MEIDKTYQEHCIGCIYLDEDDEKPKCDHYYNDFGYNITAPQLQTCKDLHMKEKPE